MKDNPSPRQSPKQSPRTTPHSKPFHSLEREHRMKEHINDRWTDIQRRLQSTAWKRFNDGDDYVHWSMRHKNSNNSSSWSSSQIKEKLAAVNNCVSNSSKDDFSDSDDDDESNDNTSVKFQILDSSNQKEATSFSTTTTKLSSSTQNESAMIPFGKTKSKSSANSQHLVEPVSPRTAYATRLLSPQKALVSLLMQLDQDAMAAMRAEFQCSPNGISLYEFVLKALTHIKSCAGSYEEIDALIEMFRDVDVNGDSCMEYEEFTSHLVQLASTYGTDSTNDQQPRYTIGNAEDTSHHEHAVEYVRYIPALHQCLVLERNSRRFKLYTSHDLRCSRIVRGHRAPLLACEYMEKMDLIVTSSSDKMVNFWSVSNDFYLVMTWQCANSLVCLRACGAQFLFAADTHGTITLYNVDRSEEKWRVTDHTDLVLDLCVLNNFSLVASASLDCTVRLWEINKGTPVAVLRGHTKGVLALAYHSELQLLISAGMDRFALVWNPRVLLPVYTIECTSPLAHVVGIEVLEGSPECIIGDSRGVFTVYDLRTFTSLQTFSVPNLTPHIPLSSFTAIVSNGLLIGSAHSLHQFRRTTGVRRERADDNPVLFAALHPARLQILTVAADNVKYWNALSGALLREEKNFLPSPISSCTIDYQYKRLYLGTQSGDIYVLNVSSGAVITKIHVHAQEVSGIVYYAYPTPVSAPPMAWTSNSLAALSEQVNDTDESEYSFLSIGQALLDALALTRQPSVSLDSGVLSCGYDAYTCRTDDKLSTVQRQMKIHQEDILFCSASSVCRLIATACSDLTVTLQSDQLGPAIVRWQLTSLPSAMAFLDPYPLLVVANSSGNLSMFDCTAPWQKHAMIELHLANYVPGDQTLDVGQFVKNPFLELEPEEKVSADHQYHPISLEDEPSNENTEGGFSSEDIEQEIIRQWFACPTSTALPSTEGWGKRASAISAIRFVPSEDRLITGDENGYVRVYNITDSLLRCFDQKLSIRPKTTQRKNDDKEAMIFQLLKSKHKNNDNQTPLIVAAQMIKTWSQDDIEQTEKLFVPEIIIRAHAEYIRGVDYVANMTLEPTILSWAEDGNVCMHNANSGKLLGSLMQGHNSRNPKRTKIWDVQIDTQRHARKELAERLKGLKPEDKPKISVSPLQYFTELRNPPKPPENEEEKTQSVQDAGKSMYSFVQHILSRGTTPSGHNQELPTSGRMATNDTLDIDTTNQNHQNPIIGPDILTAVTPKSPNCEYAPLEGNRKSLNIAKIEPPYHALLQSFLPKIHQQEEKSLPIPPAYKRKQPTHLQINVPKLSLFDNDALSPAASVSFPKI